MIRFPLRWRPWRRRAADPSTWLRAGPLRTPARVFRSEPDEPPAPEPAQPPEPHEAADAAQPPEAPEQPQVSGKPSPTASLWARLVGRIPPQKRSLYASGALVVLIVVVIIALAARPSYRVLHLLPRDLKAVSVVRVGRFLESPVYAALNAADHPAIGRLDALEEWFDVDLRRDVSLLVSTDQGRVLFGRFRASRVRSAWEEYVQAKLGERVPHLHTRYIEGNAYTFCSQINDQGAIAIVGSSVAAIGTRHGVRRFLKVRAGLYASLRDEEAVAAAYDGRLARRSLLYRIEKPGGPLLRSLEPVFTPASVRSAFFALGSRGGEVRLAIRLASESEELAEALAEHVKSDAASAPLQKLLGTTDGYDVGREEAVVTIEASLSLDAFGDIVRKDKESLAVPRNLFIHLLAQSSDR